MEEDEIKKLPNGTNIIIVNDFDYIQGGASKVAIDTANLLAEKNENINVYFFSGDHSSSSNLNEKVIKICTNQGEALKDKNKFRGCINGIYNFKAKKTLNNLLKTLDYQKTIIHVHGWTKSLSCSVFDVAFRKKYKIVLTMHDYFTACPNGGYFDYKLNEICKFKPLSLKCIKCNCDSRNYFFKIYRMLREFIQNKVVKLNLKLTDVISISEFSEKILRKTLNTNTRIYRIYNPIDLDEDITKIDYKKNKYYLYVGRISKEKGVDIFCQAITELNLKGIVVGDGDEKYKLENKYKNIEFTGWKNSHEVKEYMKNAKALIMPSRWYEGAPLTPLEALQYGIPSFVSNNCAASDIINEKNKTGKTFNLNIDDLKKCIKEFQNQEIDTKILNKFKKNYYAIQLNNLYSNLIKEEKQ